LSVTTLNPYEPEDGREATLWVSAVLVVCALHIGAAATYWLLKPEPEARAEAPVIDVAFMPATPAPAVPETQTPVAQPVPPQPDPPATNEDVQPAPEPPPQVEALVQPEPPPPPLALAMPDRPAVTKVPEQIVVVPPPEAKPDVVPQPEKPVVVPPPARKPVHEEKAEKRPAPKPAPAPSRSARVAMAPNPGAESDGAREGRTSWQAELVAHIRRIATYNSQSSESGTVSVSVTLDRSGRLKSRRVVSSSGSATLDRIATELLDRAQPYPPFPPSMTEAQVVRTVPLHLRPR
jgi:protein TonB